MSTRYERLCLMGRSFDGGAKATPAIINIQAITAVSKFVNFFRIKYVEPRAGGGDGWRSIFPSTLALLEAPSGSGKNSILSFYSECIMRLSFEWMESVLKQEAEKLLKEEERRLMKLMEEDMIGKGEADRKKLEVQFEKRLKKFEAEMRSCELDHWDDGTYEGFAKERGFMAKLPVGSKTMKSEEFGDRIKMMKNNTHLISMFGRIFELTDNDKLLSKHIKDKEGMTEGSKGLGTTTILTYSPLPRELREIAKNYIAQTIGRRGFIARETNETIRFFDDQPTYNPMEVEDLSTELWFLAQKLLERKPSGGEYIIPITEEAKLWFTSYVKEYRADMNALYTDSIPGEQKDLRACILQDRERKVLKCAVLLAVFNHGDSDFSVEVQDLEEAKALIDLFIDTAKGFFEMKQYTESMSIISSLQSLGEMSARDLFEQGFFKNTNKDKFQTIIDEVMMRDVQAKAKEFGFKIMRREKNRQYKYSLEPLSADDKFLEEVVLSDEPMFGEEKAVEYNFSFLNSYEAAKATEGYKVYGVGEGESRLVSCLSSAVVYSPILWTGGQRKAANFISTSLIVLDFDEGRTIKEMGEVFKDYKYYIAETKSHGIQKKDKPPCDRFRLILFSDVEIRDLEDYKLIMAYMTERWGADPSCKDGARYFFGAPGKKVLRNSKSSKPFPIKALFEQLKEKKKAERKSNAPYKNNLNKTPSLLIELPNGDRVDARSYIESLPTDGSTKPIKCPFHEDKTPSAFVAHLENGLEIHCSTCNVTKFIL